MPFREPAAPITSKSNARVKALRASFIGKASRAGDLLGIEGEHLVAEALRSGSVFDTVFLRQGSEDVLRRAALAGLEGADVVVLSADVFDSAVDTASPQGIAAMIEVPKLATVNFLQYAGTVLVLESLQDPGNLGTILRSAEAFGVRQIIVTPDTASAWNPKVVRASAGSVFRVPVARMPLPVAREMLGSHGYRILAAVAGAEGAVPLAQSDLSGRCALMVGNEGAGLTREALSLASARITIPCKVESFNAAIAASILLYEASRQTALVGEGAATVPPAVG